MSQQNTDLVRQIYAAFGKGDLDGLLALLDADIEWKTPGGPDLPLAGVRRGRDQVREFFRTLVELVDFEDFKTEHFIAEGDRVVVLGLDTIKVKATGKSLTEPWAHVFTIRNGKVASFQEYLDSAAITNELKTAAARA
jgi:hypothetical protein